MSAKHSSHGLEVVLLTLTSACLLLAGCAREAEQPQPQPKPWPQIKGYEAMKVPADNPMTSAKVELGKQLFYDARLSGDGSRSCYSCHLKEHGLTDGKAKAIGAYEVQLPRSSPTLWNIGYHTEFYWDGRSGSLEAQAKAAWSGGNMGASGKDGRPSLEDICARLDQIEGYRQQFQAVFDSDCTPDNVVKAIGAFERTIVSTSANSAWIRFREGDESALSEAARRGWTIFSGKAACTNCHDGLLLTDLQYHNVGVGWNAGKKEFEDVGRFKVTENETDVGAFKTPTLLDIANSTPYFHNGQAATLEEAVDGMLGGGIKNPHLDTANLEPRKLTKEEKADLLEFLRSLSVNYTIQEPALPR
ncbi:MAG TPA: cytochrome c peroxidase [Candidatus Acidoferrales bacterium]|nr:cytochrome c peroxidase [Candidatus Acidoferrales bacterium]